MAEPKEYKLKGSVKAFVYDGTEKMALEIDNSCEYSYAKYDECGSFIGLCGFTANGLRMQIPEIVNDGDYLIRYNDFYVLKNKVEFENEFEV